MYEREKVIISRTHIFVSYKTFIFVLRKRWDYHEIAITSTIKGIFVEFIEIAIKEKDK